MERVNRIHRATKEIIGDEHWENIEKLFVAFSRFEHGLIETGFIHDNQVSADWHGFSQEISDVFRLDSSETLQTACNYILDNPPWTRRNGDWIPTPLRGESHCWNILYYVKTVRNNLFHGSKYPFAPERDNGLITSCLVILDYCMAIAPPEVQEKIWEEFD